MLNKKQYIWKQRLKKEFLWLLSFVSYVRYWKMITKVSFGQEANKAQSYFCHLTKYTVISWVILIDPLRQRTTSSLQPSILASCALSLRRWTLTCACTHLAKSEEKDRLPRSLASINMASQDCNFSVALPINFFVVCPSKWKLLRSFCDISKTYIRC